MGQEHQFDTAFELASEAARRDYLAWKAEEGEKTERTESKKITEKEVRSEGSTIRLEVGARDAGDYHFEIDKSGDSQAYYHPPNDNTDDLESLYFAELTDTQKLVSVKEGWFDSRD